MAQEKIVIYSCDNCCASIFESNKINNRELGEQGKATYYVLYSKIYNFTTDHEVNIYCLCCKLRFGYIVSIRDRGVFALVSKVTPRTYVVSI